jgi:aminodeoxyfutalosine deaminase
MRKFSAQYIFTNTGNPLKRGVVTTDDNGLIISIEENHGDLAESRATEFYNGIIIPGFVNCHCHTELSHLKNKVPEKTGLGNFIEEIRNLRVDSIDRIITAQTETDGKMYREGVSVCADICNTGNSFSVKRNSGINYITFLEVFGIDSNKADIRLAEIADLLEKAEKDGLECYIIPHSVYSLSLTLLRKLKEFTKHNKVTSVHFMESLAESEFLEKREGKLMASYRNSGLLPPTLEMPYNHTDAILNEITQSGNLILVHNTFATDELIRKLKERDNIYWCLCPNSNLFIEGVLPPFQLLKSENCKIVIGTDSLASNNSISILDELRTLQTGFPATSLEELVRLSTLNGAEALCKDDVYGKIAVGSKPGLTLIDNLDLQSLKLLPESASRRLI